jgi:hypothetical protein
MCVITLILNSGIRLLAECSFKNLRDISPAQSNSSVLCFSFPSSLSPFLHLFLVSSLQLFPSFTLLFSLIPSPLSSPPIQSLYIAISVLCIKHSLRFPWTAVAEVHSNEYIFNISVIFVSQARQIHRNLRTWAGYYCRQ